MYSNENRSRRNTRGWDETGASRSKTSKKSTSQKTVYAVFTGNSAAVNRRGNRETCPATASGRKAPKYRRSFRASKLNGMMTRRIAFSCTCQPNKKDAYPQRVTAPTKVSHVGFMKSLIRHSYARSIPSKERFRGCRSLTIWKHRVNVKVVPGVMFGSTAKAVSPTRPLVPLLTAVESTARPTRGATVLVSLHRPLALMRRLTLKKNLVNKRMIL